MKKERFLVWAVMIAFIHIGLVLFFGMQKQGFHEDEYYTYWSVSSENIGPANLTWFRGDILQSRFFVKEGQQFSFEMVVDNQADDVHPPLYYLVLHCFMSLFPNSFYKWFGILLNLVFSLVTYASILGLFVNIRDKAVQNRKQLALLAGFVYAIAPSTISAVMLTRMYAMSTMWTALYAVVFVLLMQNRNCSKGKFACLVFGGAAICYGAFLTHYYALIVPFFLTLFYCIYALASRKKLGRMLLYGVSMLVAILLAGLTYPACIDHIFTGYRGADAINGFFHDSLFGRTVLFLGWINESVFAGWMWPYMIVFAVSAVIGIVLLLRGNGAAESKAFLYQMLSLGITYIVGFWVLTRLALMVGEAASRYFYPVIALLLPYMAYTVGAVILQPVKRYIEPKSENKRAVNIVCVLLVLAVVLVPIGHTYSQGKVYFLYAEDKEKIEFSKANKEYPAIMVYSNDISYRSWYVDNQLWPFEQVFYAEIDSFYNINEDAIFEAEKVVVFMDAPEEYLLHIIENNPNLSTYTLVRHDPFFYVYLLE